jgi:hypothetical protein
MMIDEELAATCADWWASWMFGGPCSDDMVFNFARELRRRLVNGLIHEDDERVTHVELYCDYDPRGTLLEALLAVGAPCKGYMFSARDVGLPYKACMVIWETGLVQVKPGRDARFMPLTLSE